MKEYNLTIDGYYIGIIELTPAEAVELEKDKGVRLERVA